MSYIIDGLLTYRIAHKLMDVGLRGYEATMCPVNVMAER